MSRLTSFDHVIVLVRDLDAATDTYARLLGRAPSWRGAHPRLASANALFRLDNTYLELLTPDGDGPLGTPLRMRLESAGEGLIGFVLGTDDAVGLAETLRSRGLEPIGPNEGFGQDRDTSAVRHFRNVLFAAEATRGVLVFAIQHLSEPDALPLVAPADPAAAIAGLDHVVVRTESPESALRFYGEQLGLRLALDETFEQWGARLLFFRIGGVTVEIAAPAKPVASPNPNDEPWGISWRVPDVEAARARLVADGFDVSETRAGRKPGTRVCTVRGPTCGVATLLIQPAAR